MAKFIIEIVFIGFLWMFLTLFCVCLACNSYKYCNNAKKRQAWNNKYYYKQYVFNYDGFPKVIYGMNTSIYGCYKNKKIKIYKDMICLTGVLPNKEEEIILVEVGALDSDRVKIVDHYLNKGDIGRMK